MDLRVMIARLVQCYADLLINLIYMAGLDTKLETRRH